MAFWRRISTPAPVVRATRFQAALAATRGHSLALAGWSFLIFMSLDDMAVLRLPGYLLAVGGTIASLAIVPVVQAVLFARRSATWDDDHVATHLGTLRITGTLAAAITAVVFVAWMIVFAAGVPPWAA